MVQRKQWRRLKGGGSWHGPSVVFREEPVVFSEPEHAVRCGRPELESDLRATQPKNSASSSDVHARAC